MTVANLIYEFTYTDESVAKVDFALDPVFSCCPSDR